MTMGCPLLRYLPEIVDIAEHMDGEKTEGKLLAVARNICQACCEKSCGGECPLGEPFGSTLRRSLPEILRAVERILERGR